MKKIFVFLIVISVFLPTSFLLSQNKPVEVPGTLEKAETKGKEILQGLPQMIKEALIGMKDWLVGLWEEYVFPFLENIWQKIDKFLEKEVEKRKPEIEKEFQKEKEELKIEIPKTTKSLWQRFKELIY